MPLPTKCGADIFEASLPVLSKGVFGDVMIRKSEFNGCSALEIHAAKSRGYRGKIGSSLSYVLGPRAVTVLVSYVHIHDLLAVRLDERDGIHSPADKPVQVRSQFDVGNARQGSFQIV